MPSEVEILSRPRIAPDHSDRAAVTPAYSGSEELRIRDLSVIQFSPTRDHLRQVFLARNVVLVAACVGIAVGNLRAEPAFGSPWIAGILALVALLNLITWYRLREPTPIFYPEFLAQILADVALLTAALYLSGGESSPYTDLYFVTMTIAAATLPWRYILAVALAIVVGHEVMCLFEDPLGNAAEPSHGMVDILTAGLIAYFAFTLATTSRKHAALLARIREDYLHRRHSTELGALAATAAHEMSSPLATMAVIVGDLRRTLGRSKVYKDSLDIVANQIEACKRISSGLLASTGHGRAEGGGKLPADKFLATVVNKCELMQPWMIVQCQHENGKPAPEIFADTSLEQAVLVLLSSTPALAPQQVELSGRWDDKSLEIRICHRAPLASADAPAPAGAPLFARSALASSDRLDLLMAKTTINRFGGTIGDQTRQDGGVCVKLSLPLP